MKKLALIIAITTLVACSKKDEVPAITNPDNIVVDGQKIEAQVTILV